MGRTVRLPGNLKRCISAGLAVLLFTFQGVAAARDPQSLPSVLSLDYCADQYVLALADRGQVKALSEGADQDFSYYAERARGLPQSSGQLDEVLFLRPQVLLQTWNSAPRLSGFAKGQGINVILTDYGSDAETVFGNIARVGKALGQEARADALIEDLSLRLKRLDALPPLGQTAAYVTPGGVTAGVGTQVDTILTTAGFTSWAKAHDLRGWQALPLEDLVLDPPDFFVGSFFDTSSGVDFPWSLARHGRLLAMMKARPTVTLPGAFLSCNGLFVADAAERIRRDAEAFLEGRGVEVTHAGGPE